MAHIDNTGNADKTGNSGNKQRGRARSDNSDSTHRDSTHRDSNGNRDGNSDSNREHGHQALRSEAPSTVGLLGDARDFAAMRAYRSFAFDNHPHYLGQMENLLRDMASQGIHVFVGLFRPGEYAKYCAETGQDPDSALARTRYTADITAGGPTVSYAGQPLDDLVVQLTYETDRQATWERATDLLAQAGDCADCGQDLAQEAFGRASQALMGLVETAGPGRHHMVCSVPVDQAPLLAALHASRDDQEHIHLTETDALIFCTVLAAGIVTETPGGVVLRSDTGTGTDQVRGWTLRDGWLQPLTEAEVFNAYCTDAQSGEPVPPEPGVEYCAGTPLTRPED